tara:strand:+ start:382 stop:1263 length:882 start_codon:yes stop_codon:yes gene_type:complete
MLFSSESPKKFNFYIMTNSRVESTVKLLKQLGRFNNFGNIFISDSGGRDKKIFDQALKKISKDNICFELIDNSKFSESPFLHWWSILDNGKENLFIFHDDDEIHENEFIKILQGNFTDEYDFICSTLKGKNPDFSDHDSKSKTEKINNIIETYILSPSGNCPLLTGLFIKRPYELKAKIPVDFLIKGNYGDVSFMSWLFSQDGSLISNLNYINHIDHGNNHNSSRSLYSRDLLHKFIFNRNSFEMKIISFLIYFNYPSRTHYFIAGLLLSSFAPSLWPKILKKIFSVLKKIIF